MGTCHLAWKYILLPVGTCGFSMEIRRFSNGKNVLLAIGTIPFSHWPCSRLKPTDSFIKHLVSHHPVVHGQEMLCQVHTVIRSDLSTLRKSKVRLPQSTCQIYWACYATSHSRHCPIYTPRSPVRDAHILQHKGPTCEKTACVSEGTTDCYFHMQSINNGTCWCSAAVSLRWRTEL